MMMETRSLVLSGTMTDQCLLVDYSDFAKRYIESDDRSYTVNCLKFNCFKEMQRICY